MNIKSFALALAIMPAIALAQDNNSAQDTISNKNGRDTTFVFNKQKYEISQTSERTNIKVYKDNGTELKKTLETQPLSRHILRCKHFGWFCLRRIIGRHIHTRRQIYGMGYQWMFV